MSIPAAAEGWPTVAEGTAELGRESLAGPDQLKVHTWYLLNRAAQLLREAVEAALLPLGLRRRHYAALAVIDTEGPLTQRELSDRIPIDRVAMVSVINDLEAAGLAERQPCPGDRRAHALSLTRKGDEVLRKARAAVDAADDAGLVPLSADERSQLDSLARRLCGWELPEAAAAPRTHPAARRVA